jgi:hypothetical protein
MTSPIRIQPDDNVGQLSIEYMTALTALHSSGATFETANFIFNNAGIVLTVMQRLIALRENDVSEETLFALLREVFHDGN